jgi:WD40 repeat protein
LQGILYVALKRFLIILLFVGLSFSGMTQFYTGSNLTFGRKRVQYDTFFWSFYRFSGFDVYFSRNGKNLALYTASFVQNNLQDIEQRVGEPITEQMQFIIFNRLTDYKQSNIGYLEEENYNSGGITKINDNKVFLFFDGDYVDFERQIREGIAEILVRQVLFGTSLASQVRNNSQLSVPDWFLYGLISYLSTPWNTEFDDIMRDAMLSRRFRFIAALEGENAKMAGHSLFRYIAETHGDGSILRILRVVAAQRKVESGLRFVLNVSYKQLMRDWQAFYVENTRFEGETEKPDLKHSLRRVRQKDREHYQFKVSSDGNHLAFISNELGRARVHVRNLKTGKRRVIMSIGYAINDMPDYSYPALAWHPNGEILAIAAERRGITSLYLYDVKTREMDWINMESLEKILSIDYAPNGREIVLSGVQNGMSDIFHFNVGTRVLTPVTRDIYDDANPRFLKNGTQIMFSSNRLNDTLTRNKRYSKAPILNPNHDLFIYDLTNQTTTLLRVTNDSNVNFSNPVEYENGVFAFLTDENGVRNRALGVIDSVVASVDTIIHWRYTTDYRTVTNLNRNIQEQDVGAGLAPAFIQGRPQGSPQQAQQTEIVTFKNKNRLILTEVEPSQDLETKHPPKTKFRIAEQLSRQKKLEDLQIADSLRQFDSLQNSGKRRLRQSTARDMVNEMTDEILRQNITVGAGFARPEGTQTVPQQDDSIRDELRERLIRILGLNNDASDTIKPTINPQQRNYNVEFSINEATTQVGFSFLNSSYQQFTGGNNPIYLNPGLTSFLKIAATDLMENHRLVMGYRLSLDFRSNEFLLSYENLEHRTGRQYVFHRQAITQHTTYNIYNQLSHNAYYILKHPLTEVLLLKGTAIGRVDKTVIKATDDWSLRQPDEWRLWGGLRGELIYDHVRMLGTNLPLGARSKVWGEYYQSLTEKETTMFVVGADYRHYMRIFRTFIWANRVAGSTSFGQTKLIYYMGGVDDWLLPRFNRDIQVDETQNYSFQTLATNMRGFTQNIRNGNTFVVASSELRLPIMQTLFARPIGGQWLQNLQLVGFVDAGSAWVGWNPWNKDNAIYRKVIYDPTGDLTITILKDLSPFVAGIGYGLRTSLAGYFIRIDRGNGIENGRMNRRIWYFSMGFDF